jgi:hypothetical protein
MAEQFDEYYLALPFSYMMSDHRCARATACGAAMSRVCVCAWMMLCRNLRKEVLDPVAVAGITRKR